MPVELLRIDGQGPEKMKVLDDSILYYWVVGESEGVNIVYNDDGNFDVHVIRCDDPLEVDLLNFQSYNNARSYEGLDYSDALDYAKQLF